ncbi:methyl-accepting chemotaxis protein [Thalassolituus sp. C2-1]|uniref:methyl-accepting chemotaxis protein n=1 Tax=Venatorbacter sp. C2-1 TaxID=2597518 RepID=UPI001194EE35|nr:methyl-accepting chemotaxis protein [Thalassolituus sp. C2-1]TVV45559.1 methyl-accepting chemotaxis protein [Thalassolituus sp. C2-1]
MPAVPDEDALRKLISRELETIFYEKAEIAIPVLVFVALTSVKRITAGLNNLAEGVIRIADPATPLSYRLQARDMNELSALGNGLNHFMNRIEPTVKGLMRYPTD